MVESLYFQSYVSVFLSLSLHCVLFLLWEEWLQLGSALLEMTQPAFQETLIFCLESFLSYTDIVEVKW